MELPYKNRSQAGRELADALQPYANRPDVLVLALPRGGVPVAYQVAKSLNAPMDLMLVRKLGLPGHEELAMGAIATGGIRVLNAEAIQGLGISEAQIEQVAAREWQELRRRERIYRDDRPIPEVQGRCVILIDDGLATGATMQAAIAALRQQRPSEIVVAVPVAPPGTVASLRQQADAVICPAMPEPFCGVGVWYEDFSQVTDAEVRELLGAIWHSPPERERLSTVGQGRVAGRS
jgi:putative phosphoribosyl transferase